MFKAIAVHVHTHGPGVRPLRATVSRGLGLLRGGRRGLSPAVPQLQSAVQVVARPCPVLLAPVAPWQKRGAGWGPAAAGRPRTCTSSGVPQPLQRQLRQLRDSSTRGRWPLPLATRPRRGWLMHTPPTQILPRLTWLHQWKTVVDPLRGIEKDAAINAAAKTDDGAALTALFADLDAGVAKELITYKVHLHDEVCRSAGWVAVGSSACHHVVSGVAGLRPRPAAPCLPHVCPACGCCAAAPTAAPHGRCAGAWEGPPRARRCSHPAR